MCSPDRLLHRRAQHGAEQVVRTVMQTAAAVMNTCRAA
jgi:hypothetical protein